jgi:hypothetical protein
MDTATLLELLTQGGAVAILVYFFVAAYKGWIIFRREFDSLALRLKEVERERNDWRALALKGTSLADSLAAVSERRVFGERE